MVVSQKQKWFKKHFSKLKKVAPKLGSFFSEWILLRKANGYSQATLATNFLSCHVFLKAMKHLGKDLQRYNRITKEDILNFKLLLRDENSDFYVKTVTLHHYIIAIRLFCRWILEEKPELGWDESLAEIKVPKKTDEKEVQPDELISTEELHKLLRSCMNRRDKALIALVFETGLRINEALNLKFKDIIINDTHITLKIDGTKTKESKRRVIVIDSQKYIMDWINDHPTNNDKESYLFISIGQNFGTPLEYIGAASQLRRIARRAGIRPIYWHLFRHTSATIEAVRGMNPKLMNKKFGWSPESRTPFIYINLSEKDLEDYELERRGIKVPEKEEREKALEPKVCPRCGKINEVTALVCNICGCALDPSVITKERDELEAQFKEINEMKLVLDKALEQLKEYEIKIDK